MRIRWHDPEDVSTSHTSPVAHSWSTTNWLTGKEHALGCSKGTHGEIHRVFVKTVNQRSAELCYHGTGKSLVAVRLRTKFSMRCSGYARAVEEGTCEMDPSALPEMNKFVIGMPKGRSVEDWVHY